MTPAGSFLMRVIVVLVLLVLGTTPVAPASASGPSDERDLITIPQRDRYFSPNGDGVSDRATFAVRLDRRAFVSVLVRGRDGRVVRRARLGVLPEGRHQWHWDGRSNAGQVVPDDWYTVVLRARGGNRVGRDQTTTNVATKPDAGRLVLSRPVVYPAADVVTDGLDVVYVRAGYSEDLRQNWMYYDPPMRLHTRLVIIAPDGRRVLDATTKAYRAAFSWSARAESGKPLPAGTYRLRVTVRDAVGNVRRIGRTIEVSTAQLAERVWTATIPAASAEQAPGPVYDAGCNGCGEVCGPVPSERFPGGLSFRQPCDFGYAAERYFGASPPVVPAPVDSFRVTATGGPTAPGDTDVASFDGIVMGPGDASVTTPWEGVELDEYPYLPDARLPITWDVSTSQENDYDIASFTVEYRYYVPVE